MVVDYDVVSQGVPGLEGLVKEPMQVRTTSSSAADMMNIIDLKEVDEGGAQPPVGRRTTPRNSPTSSQSS